MFILLNVSLIGRRFIPVSMPDTAPPPTIPVKPDEDVPVPVEPTPDTPRRVDEPDEDKPIPSVPSAPPEDEPGKDPGTRPVKTPCIPCFPK